MKSIVLITVITIFVLFAGCDLTTESPVIPVEELIVATINANWAGITLITTSESSPRTIAASTGNHARPGEGFFTVYIEVKPQNAPWQITWESTEPWLSYDKTRGQIVCTGPGDGKITFTTVGKDKDGKHISYDVFIRSTVTGG